MTQNNITINNSSVSLFDNTNEYELSLNIELSSLKNNYSSFKYNFIRSGEKISKEEFKDIPEYEGHYQISNKGNVKSLKRNGGKMLSPSIGKKSEYFRICLYKNKKRKSFYIHQLVAITFLGHKPNGGKMVVDHISNDKTDNTLSNLQVISSRENSSKDQWRRNPSSFHVGVCLSTSKKKWESSISVNGISFHLGYFNDEYIAAQEYINALDYIDKHSSLIDYPFKTKRRVIINTDKNQLTFTFT